MKRWIGTLIFSLLFGLASPVAAKDFHLEISHLIDGKPLAIGRAFDHRDTRITLARIDWLMSEIAFQRADGSWMESRDWAEFISEEKQRRRGVIYGIPNEDYQAVRFKVGLPKTLNQLDPNRIKADSPLHPLTNNLHWGWQGGFIFAAIEGNYESEQKQSGFSYHLASDGNAIEIILPVKIQTPRDSTLSIGFDLGPLFRDIQLGKSADSTHSREDDPLLPILKRAILEGFSARSLSSDLFQQPAVKSLPVETTTLDLPPTTPFPLKVSKRLPRFELPADNPLSVEGVALGERLFFDKRLSGNNRQSCASCHDPGLAFTDSPKRISTGAEGQTGRRNSMPLFNLLWHDQFFWDGRAKTLREQLLMPIEDPTEMNQKLPELIDELNADVDLQSEFANVFGARETGITPDQIAQALEQYLLTQISQDSKFDQAARGEAELTATEKRGLQLFVTEFDPENGKRGADCFHCHSGNLFTSRRFTNNGLLPMNGDNGLFEATGNPADKLKFKTPSLRNLTLTAPYMHDGRFETLEEVIDHYDSGIHPSETLDPNIAKHPAEGLQLSADDKHALIAFLRTLTDTRFGPSVSPSTSIGPESEGPRFD